MKVCLWDVREGSDQPAHSLDSKIFIWYGILYLKAPNDLIRQGRCADRYGSSLSIYAMKEMC